MSAESELRAVLIAHAPLVAAVPATRIAVDTADADSPKPFIVFSKESDTPQWGLDNTLVGRHVVLSVQVVGSSRSNAIEVRELVEEALMAEGIPWSGGNGGYDPEADIEAEVLTVEWIT